MAQTVIITTSSNTINIYGYSSRGAVSNSNVTIYNPVDMKLFLNGDVITLQIEAYPPFTFTQILDGANAIGEINGVDFDVEDETPDWVLNELKLAFLAIAPKGGAVAIVATSAEILTVQTSGTGASYVAFGGATCNAVDVTNNTGVDIEYRRNGSGLAMPIINTQSRLIVGIVDASEIAFRRIDQIGTPVTIYAEAIVA
jgi:hypothetical protein